MSRENRDDLEQLAIALANAKDVEANAKRARVEAEEALAAAIGGKDVGSTSVQCGRIGATVKRGWNYRIDEPIVFAKEHPDFVKTRIELRDSAYEKVRESNPALFAELSQHVTVTPKKVSVELKL